MMINTSTTSVLGVDEERPVGITRQQLLTAKQVV